MGRHEQSFHLMLVPRFLQSPRKMGPTGPPPPPPHQSLSSLGLQPPSGISILSYIWFNLQFGTSGRKGGDVCK